MQKQLFPYVSPLAESFPLKLADVVCGTQYSAKYGESGKAGVFEQEDVYDGGTY